MAASATPIGFCSTMWTMKKKTLLPSAFQKLADQRGSKNSVRKFSSPTNASRPSTTRNSDSRSVSASGTIISSRVDEYGGREEHRDVPAAGTADGESVGHGSWSGFVEAPPVVLRVPPLPEDGEGYSRLNLSRTGWETATSP